MGKKEMRKRLAALSFSEKVRILEKLRDRSLALAASGLRRPATQDVRIAPDHAEVKDEMYCVYCGKDHDGSVEATNEHVVPFALGGSNALKIRVCRNANNSLGGLVDKPFIEMFPVRAHRFFLGLSGTDGTPPTLELGGESEIHGKKVSIAYTITQDSKELKIADPTVTKMPTEEGELWTVSGDPEKVRQVVEGKLKSLNAQRKQMKSESGKIVSTENLDTILSSARAEHLKPGIVKTVTVDLLGCRRFFAKIALSAGHFILGEAFSRSTGADTLRKVMHGSGPETAGIPRALIWPEADGAQQLFGSLRMGNSHVLGILDGEPPVFVASLFGTYDAFIPLAALEGDRSPTPGNGGRILQIELPSRKFHDRTLSDHLEAFLAALRARKSSADFGRSPAEETEAD